MIDYGAIAGYLFFTALVAGGTIWFCVKWWQYRTREEKRMEEAEKAFQHIMAHGTFEEKQLALMYKQNQKTNALIGMVTLGIFLDQ